MSNVSMTFPDMLASSDVQVAYKMMRPLHIIDIIFLHILNHPALLIMPYKATELQLVIRLHYLKKNNRKKNLYMLRRNIFLLLISSFSRLGQETSVELLDTVPN